MAQPSSVTPVKLFVVTLHREQQPLQNALDAMKASWGDIDYTSDDFTFAETDYYEKEMGPDLKRRFYSFSRLISPDEIVEAKLLTNQIEDESSSAGQRTINLDPGYLDYYKVVLASTKFGGQKLYMRQGIYADMTLILYKGKWESFYWGFPDFKSGKYDSVLFAIRDLYKRQISGR